MFRSESPYIEPGNRGSTAIPFSTSVIHPEDRLLLLACRTLTETASRADLPLLLNHDLNWGYVVQRAKRLGVIPLLTRLLRGAAAGVVPDRVHQDLHAKHRRLIDRNVVLTAELLELAEMCDDLRVNCIPHRGPIAAVMLYEDLKLRGFTDLDLLVRRHEFPRLKEALLDRGFHLYPELPLSRERDYARLDYDWIFKNARGVYIDVRSAVLPRFFGRRLAAPGIWARSVVRELGGREMLVMCPEDMLITMAAHASKHCWSRLDWVCDIACILMRHPDLDWDQVAQRIQSTGTRRMVHVGLLLSFELLSAPVPPFMLDAAIRDETVLSLVHDVGRRFFSPVPPGPYRGVMEAGFHMRISERRRDQFCYLWRQAFMPTVSDWDVIDLPRPLSFLYYVARPFRIAVKFLRRIFRDG
ncbi:MAG: nucleotidyltransferase family protein [Verrucomicrobia bacterium]|nr:nucleotidyltransferase family protein [Verrucomicrobiota bacterium]